LYLALGGPSLLAAAATEASKPWGLDSRPRARPYLSMPDNADGSLPRLLSETGAFADARRMVPAESLIPYDLIFPFWSDGATKSRWISVPNDGSFPATIRFSEAGEWTFPKGTVFVKNFELPADERHPEVRRRLETRLLVCNSTGGVYGVTYKWRPDNSDAELLASNLTESIVIQTASGQRTQRWYYPGRQDCLTCHTRNAGLVLGVKTRQLDREFAYPNGVTDNELRTWNHLGLFEAGLDETKLAGYARLARPDDATRSLEDRARSYLDANCAHCHRPGGTVAYFDARYDTPLPQQGLISGPILLDLGVDGAKVIAPRDIWRSTLFSRVKMVADLKMPPLAHEMLDQQGVQLVRQWIEDMPGPPVLPPPAFSVAGGDFNARVTVTLHESEPDATIRYTLDGSRPTSSDAIYEKPIELTASTTIRAKAFKAGFTKSITVQETYITGN
jgi:uncharacterized repeat protein (TIGR03806 family)